MKPENDEFEYCDDCGWAIEDCSCFDKACDFCGTKNNNHILKCPNNTNPYDLMRTRIFINHPAIGTVIVPKSRPKWNSKRYRIMETFVYALSLRGEITSGVFDPCKCCKRALLNPHSILMHIGNHCEKQKL